MNEELSKEKLLQGQVNDMQKKMRDLTQDLAGKFVDLGHGMRVSKEAWDRLSDKAKADAKHIAKMLDIRDVARQIVVGMEDVFYRSLNNIREHGFRRFFKDIIGMFDDMLFQIAAKWLANQFIRLLIGAVGGSSAVDQLLGGARAMGGQVDAGRAYLVGERGPELFVPSSRGAVTPNSQLGGGGMVVNVSIVAHDVQSFTRSEQQVTSQIARSIALARARNA
jgi:hypothetical protein